MRYGCIPISKSWLKITEDHSHHSGYRSGVGRWVRASGWMWMDGGHFFHNIQKISTAIFKKYQRHHRFWFPKESHTDWPLLFFNGYEQVPHYSCLPKIKVEELWQESLNWIQKVRMSFLQTSPNSNLKQLPKCTRIWGRRKQIKMNTKKRHS